MKGYIVCFFAALFFSYELLQLHMLNAIAPYLLKDFGISALELGVLGSTYIFADILFLLPAGILLDRYLVKHVMLAALALCVLGTFGFSFSQTLLEASFFHFLSGIGNAFCFLSCMILATRWFSLEKQPLIMGSIVTIGLFGGMIAQTPFAELIAYLSWRQALLVDGVFGSLLFFCIYLFVEEGPNKKEQLKKIPFKEAFLKACTSPVNILFGLYIGLMNLPLMVIGAVLGSLFFMQGHGFSLKEASFISSMICFGTIIGSPIFGFLAKTEEKMLKYMIFGSLSSIITMLFIMYPPISSCLFFSLLFFFLGFFTSTQVLGYPLISEKSPKEITGISLAFSGVIIMGLAAIAQPFSGYLLDSLSENHVYTLQSFTTTFWIFPISFFLAFVFVSIFFNKRFYVYTPQL